MTKEKPVDDFGEIRESLQILSQEQGVWRPNLLELLQGELTVLRKRWGIDLDNGTIAARRIVTVNLNALIERLTMERGRQPLDIDQRRLQYEHAIAVAFNTAKYPELRGMTLEDRRDWLEDKEARKLLYISKSTGQRDLRKAIDQIAQILSGETYSPVPAVDTDETARGPVEPLLEQAIGPGGQGNEALGEGVPSGPAGGSQSAQPLGRNRRKLYWRTGSTVATIAIVLAATILFFNHRPATSQSGATSSALPVAIESVTDEETGASPLSYVFPQKLLLSSSELATLNGFVGNYGAFNAWVSSRGGVKSNVAQEQVVLRGNSDQPVLVTGIQVIATCSAPLAGTLLYTQGQGANSVPNIGFDLDSQFPVAQDYAFDHLSGSYFAEHTVSLVPGEVETLTLNALVSQKYCRYYYRLSVDTSTGATVFEKIDDHGKPFQITAATTKYSNYQAVYSANSATDLGIFVPEDPATYQGN
jgi:hypothetical protein